MHLFFFLISGQKLPNRQHLFSHDPEPRFHHLCYSGIEPESDLFSSTLLWTCRSLGLLWRNPMSRSWCSGVFFSSTNPNQSTTSGLCTTFHFNTIRFPTPFKTRLWAEITCAQWHFFLRRVTWCLRDCPAALLALRCYLFVSKLNLYFVVSYSTTVFGWIKCNVMFWFDGTKITMKAFIICQQICFIFLYK